MNTPVRVFESFTDVAGRVDYRWLWMASIGSQRRFFLTEDAARAAIAKARGDK